MSTKYPGGYQIVDLSAALNDAQIGEGVVIDGIYSLCMNAKKPLRFTMSGKDANQIVTSQTLMNSVIIIPPTGTGSIFIAIPSWDAGSADVKHLYYVAIEANDNVAIVEP